MVVAGEEVGTEQDVGVGAPNKPVNKSVLTESVDERNFAVLVFALVLSHH